MVEALLENTYSKQMDIIKGLGIIAIVIGHTSTPLHDYLYAYHVVLFFFISGYFYKDDYSSKPFGLFIKRMKTLYAPFVFYELIFLMFHNVFINLNFLAGELYSWKDLIKGAFMAATFHEIEPILLSQFWFIKVLFMVNIAFAVMSYIINKVNVNAKELIRALLICAIFTANILYLLYLNKQSGYIGIKPSTFTLVPPSLLAYYAGYIYKRYESFIKLNLYLFIICLGGIIVNCMFVSTYVMNFYLYPFFFISNSVFGIYCNLYVAKVLDSKNKNSLLIYIGKNTIVILAMHIVCYMAVNFIQIPIYGLDYSYMNQRAINGHTHWWIAYSIAGVFLPLAIKNVVQAVYGFLKRSLVLKGRNAN